MFAIREGGDGNIMLQFIDENEKLRIKSIDKGKRDFLRNLTQESRNKICEGRIIYVNNEEPQATFLNQFFM